jgi:hypothetical protein
VVILVLGVRIADNFYPLSTRSVEVLQKMPRDERMELEVKEVETYMIQSAYLAILTVLIASRLVSLSGAVRSAIRRWREENQAALGSASE